MLQHTGMKVVDHSNQCRISYTISDIGYLTNIDTDIIITLVYSITESVSNQEANDGYT